MRPAERRPRSRSADSTARWRGGDCRSDWASPSDGDGPGGKGCRNGADRERRALHAGEVLSGVYVVRTRALFLRRSCGTFDS